MNDYLRENKIEALPPQGGVVAEAGPEKPAESADKAKNADQPVADDAAAKKPAKASKQAT